MKVVSYNTHYAIGKDSQYDLQRVVDAVRGADIIALQEIERNYGPPHQPSQPEDIAKLMPNYYWVFDAAFDLDGSEKQPDGTVINRRRQHGQMLLSRWPILGKRYFPLPRIDTGDEFNMQMGALEGIFETPCGPLRIYVVHFGSVSSDERQRQAEFILNLVRNGPIEGGVWTGPAHSHVDRDWSAGLALPPMPETSLVIGDFNTEPNSPEYQMLTGETTDNKQPLLTDIWAKLNPDKSVVTWIPNSDRPGDETSALLDYCFLTADLVPRAQSSWVDEAADGSDHQPIWVEFQDS